MQARRATRPCPVCKGAISVTTDGALALHYVQGPGVGIVCSGEAKEDAK